MPECMRFRNESLRVLNFFFVHSYKPFLTWLHTDSTMQPPPSSRIEFYLRLHVSGVFFRPKYIGKVFWKPICETVPVEIIQLPWLSWVTRYKYDQLLQVDWQEICE